MNDYITGSKKESWKRVQARARPARRGTVKGNSLLHDPKPGADSASR